MGQRHQIVLGEQAAQWPTPQAHDATGARGENNFLSDHHYKPHDLAMATAKWQTPQSRDFRSGKIKPCLGSRPLNEQVPSRPAQPTSQPGPRSSTEIRRLNPRFVEMLMGLPLGWTASAPLEMQSFRSWQLTHSAALRELPA